MTTKEYIISRLREFDPTLDLGEGSALVDLLVNPGAAMLDPLIAQMNFLITNIGMVSPTSLDEGELDALAANFLKARITGGKAVGVVELFYNNPINLDIPAGTTFTTSNGIVFETTQSIHIPLSNMAANTWNFPRYSTGPISVVAKEYGVISAIGPNEIKTTNLIPTPALVTNPASFTGGVDRESNVDFINRIIDETITASLGSGAGIQANLSSDYPSILEIKTRGMNDIEMLRDLVYSGIQVYSNYYSVDFYGKVSGLNESPFPESIAYWNVFYDNPTTSGLIEDLPTVADFTDQFTSGQYGGIYRVNDVLKTTIQTLTVLEDTFQDAEFDPDWQMSDSMVGLNRLKDPNEITLTTVSGTQMLRLGNRMSIADIDSQGVVALAQTQLYNILNYIAFGNTAAYSASWAAKLGLTQKKIESYSDILDLLLADTSADDNLLTTEERELWNIIRALADTAKIEKNHNFYPMATRRLAKHAGVTVTGRFMTDDTSTDGKLSYVTVLRDESSIDPSNGFGFAWMKNDASNSLFNVYLVDNSALANDLFVSPNFIVLPQGENAFKAAAKVDIKADKLYRFKLTIGSDYATELRIWLDGGAEPALPQLSTGAPLNVMANGTHIGFGIMGTENSQWFYDDLLVQNSDGVHTSILYRLKADPAQFPNGTYARVNHYGYGYDGYTYGLSAFIKEYDTDTSSWGWTAIGTNTSTNVSDHEATKLSHQFLMSNTFRDTDNFIDVLVTSTESSDQITEVTSYYANLETGIPSGIHTGGCADIYINDPDSVVVAEQTINNVTGNLALDSTNGFVTPIHSIIEVQTALIGESLVENSDWTLITPNEATALSTQEYPYLTFDSSLINTKVKVIYRYYAHGSSLQSRMESDQYRYSGTSNLIKIMPPVIVRVNTLRYRGTVTVSAIQDAIKSYVTRQLTKITRNELLSAVYSAGATYVDIPTLDIEVIATDYKRVTADPVQLVADYTKEDLAGFFTDAYELNGVIKL